METLPEWRSEATMLLFEYEQLSGEMVAQSEAIKLIKILQYEFSERFQQLEMKANNVTAEHLLKVKLEKLQKWH